MAELLILREARPLGCYPRTVRVLGVKVWNDGHVALVVESLMKAFGQHGVPDPPSGYPHSGLAVVDAVFSVRANYVHHVVPVVNHFCGTIVRLAPRDARFDESVPEYSIAELASNLAPLYDRQLAERFGNQQVSPGTHVLKAVTVRVLASTLVEMGVRTGDDLRKRWNDPKVAEKVLGITGVGVATWRYLLSLSSIERVKSDTTVAQWVQNAANLKELTPAEAADLLDRAVTTLQAGGSDATLRAVERFVFRIQSELTTS